MIKTLSSNFWISIIFGASLLLTVYIRHSKHSTKIANGLHKLSSHHPVLGEFLVGRYSSTSATEKELRRTNKSRFISLLLFIIACMFFINALGYL